MSIKSGCSIKSKSKTKAEIQEQIKLVNLDIERGKANISKIETSIKGAKARVKELEIEKDMALS